MRRLCWNMRKARCGKGNRGLPIWADSALGISPTLSLRFQIVLVKERGVEKLANANAQTLAKFVENT